MSSFISGLKDELRSMVKIMVPTMVRQATEKARLQELTLEAIYKKNKAVARPLPPSSHPLGGKTRTLMAGGATGGPRVNPSPLRSTTMEQRRLMGLYYRCGEKFSLGHQCRRQLLNMEREEEDGGEELADEGEGEQRQEVTKLNTREETEQEGVEISFHTLKGGTTGKIIKVQGQVRQRKLLVLIDSGSTHNFLNEATIMELRCRMTATTPLSVTVANGSKMYSHNQCKGFRWLMQGQEFQVDLRVLELGGCDIVLGVDWMRTVSPLTFNFNKLEVTMDMGSTKLTLMGIMEQRECKLIKGSKLQRLM